MQRGRCRNGIVKDRDGDCISGEGCEGNAGEGTIGALSNADSKWDVEAGEPFALLEMGEDL